MITRIEAQKFRCLREVNQSLRPFQILVGPNASGKSAFMDVLAFLSTLVSEGLQATATERSKNFHDLVWGRGGYGFGLAVEARPPEPYDARVEFPEHVTGQQPAGAGNPSPPPATDTGAVPLPKIRYQVEVHLDPETGQAFIAKESVGVEATNSGGLVQIEWRDGNEAHFTSEDGHREHLSAIISPDYSVLHLVPFATRDLPLRLWLRGLLSERVQGVSLEADKLRKPSPPSYGKIKIFDGSQLARLVTQLKEKSPQSFRDWLSHVQTALPDLESIRVELQPWDQHRYLMLRYKNGVDLPSWTVSDGTLRLLALTILAYMPEGSRIYLVEEPENGIHPTAIDAIYQSLSSIYEGQVLVASHSPILLNLAKPEELLCFVKTNEGTEVVAGDQHPILMNWKGEVALSDLFAGGVLS